MDPPVVFGTVTFTQPFPELPYESCATTPQAVRPPKTTITATAAIAKIRFCRGVRRPARGLVLAYMDAQCRQQKRGQAGPAGPVLASAARKHQGEATEVVTRDTRWPGGTPRAGWISASTISRRRSASTSQFGWGIQQGGPEVGGYSMAQPAGAGTSQASARCWARPAPRGLVHLFRGQRRRRHRGQDHGAGGQLLAGPMDVMDVGRMVIAADVTGAVFGLWQARNHTGVQVANVPGAFTWSEHMSATSRGPRRSTPRSSVTSTATCPAPASATPRCSSTVSRWSGASAPYSRGRGRGAPGPLGGLLRHRRHRQVGGPGHEPWRPGGPPGGRQPLRPDGDRRRQARRGLQPHLHPADE